MMMNNPLLANSRPWCIGRFVFDRPAASEISSERYGFWGDEIEIRRNVSFQTFDHEMRKREETLRREKRESSISYQEMKERGLESMRFKVNVPMLEQVASPTQNSRVFLFTMDGKRPDPFFKQEGYVLAGGTMLAMKSTVPKRIIQSAIAGLSEVLRDVTYRDDWTVPTEPGFCIDGALIGGRSRDSERVTQSFALLPGRYAGLLIRMRDAVESDKKLSLRQTLPDLRGNLNNKGFSGNVRFLRDGKRQVAGMEAEEVLFSITDGTIQIYQFYLMAQGDPETVAQPHTEIRLTLGGPSTHSLTPELATSPVDEAGAIQMWDTLLNSMRLRPGAL
ncbi:MULTISPECIES: T6SS immunity protein Tli4 family protein [unclassified Cupriavidus]|jgi:hypothetical protein|uniref:T6SS immunity protein Tli4 family protein n=1 Tax=unclassified Cupriavidus TaxID=2640874 RepID=UPI0039780D22